MRSTSTTEARNPQLPPAPAAAADAPATAAPESAAPGLRRLRVGVLALDGMLLSTYGRRGLVAPLADVLGIDIAFTTLAVVLAQTFVAAPFLILTVEGALRARGTAYEATALTLGAVFILGHLTSHRVRFREAGARAPRRRGISRFPASGPASGWPHP